MLLKPLQKHNTFYFFVIMNFIDKLKNEIILGDGAMGTVLYSRGIFINRCYEELNLLQPDVIEKIHKEYVNAGSDLIETNTFRANSISLLKYGLSDKTAEINIKGAEIAAEAAKTSGKKIYVAGSMGPTGLILENEIENSRDEASSAFKLQAKALVKGGVDVIILETFYSMDELILAVESVKTVVDIPVVAQFTFDSGKSSKYKSKGITPEKVAQQLVDCGADVIGTNCGAGPAALLSIVERMSLATDKPVSVFANANVSEMHEGRMITLGTSPEYVAEYARRYAQAGAKIIGGCCGTNPETISEISRFLKGVVAEQRSQIFTKEKVGVMSPVPLEERSMLGKLLTEKNQKRKLVSVELSPPMGINPSKVIEGVKLLKKGGVDFVNIPDGPRAVPRMSPIATAKLVHDATDMETIIHYCCRDRNLLGMQMDLLGSSALGLNNLMLITGDPPKVGNVQSASPVFDVDSIGLINLVSRLNGGRGLADADLKCRTKFVIGAGCNPGAVDIEEEIRRFEAKINAGANFFFSQPVYLPELLERFMNMTEQYSHIPIFVGILPLASLRNAEFLHNEVPGMQIPNEIMDKMRSAETKVQQQKTGIEIARKMLKQVIKSSRVKGIYLFPPFGRYESVLEVMEAI